MAGISSISDEECVEGVPELIIEIANSSRAIDLHAKKEDYARYGVREYLVPSVQEQQIWWFDLSAGANLQADDKGTYRIHAFSGLWINGPALFAYDYAALMETLEAGLATPEHAAFVKSLAERKSDGDRCRAD